MKLAYIDVNQAFKEKIELLKTERGISFAAIAKSINMPNHRIKAIRIGNSSAKVADLEALENAFPGMFKKEELAQAEENIGTLTKKVGILEKEVKLLQVRNNSLELAVNMLTQLIIKKNAALNMNDNKQNASDLEELKRLEEHLTKLQAKNFELLVQNGLDD